MVHESTVSGQFHQRSGRTVPRLSIIRKRGAPCDRCGKTPCDIPAITLSVRLPWSRAKNQDCVRNNAAGRSATSGGVPEGAARRRHSFRRGSHVGADDEKGSSVVDWYR